MFPIWKKVDLVLYGRQSLKYDNIPIDVWKYVRGREPEMLYPENLVQEPLFELHLGENDNPFLLYSNIDDPLNSRFRKRKKTKSPNKSKNLKKKKTNKSKSLKSLKLKKTKSLKKLKLKKTKSLKKKKSKSLKSLKKKLKLKKFN